VIKNLKSILPGVEIEKTIRGLLERENIRLTPSAVIAAVQERIPANRRQIMDVIRSMVKEGRLVYTYVSGSTHLEYTPRGPRRVSDRIVLHMGQGGNWCAAGTVVVHLNAGASFGCGDHPTTCLALQGLDFTLTWVARVRPLETLSVLDIGTGTGVLAIAAAMLGIGKVTAVDVDPVACHEALLNVNINAVESRISVIHGGVDDLNRGPYDIIIANLRPPTIVQLAERMRELTKTEGWWIFSGFRQDEKPGIENRLSSLREIWAGSEKAWSAASYQVRGNNSVQVTRVGC
jgi:ribosomal protein L11 methyltransferase